MIHLRAIIEYRWVALLLIACNLIGAVWGVIAWYGSQLAGTPLVLWPFVPDSPANAFLFIPALLLILRRKPGWPWLNALAAFGNIKYGLWTVIFWTLYWLGGGPMTFMGIAMTFTHLGMALGGVYLLGYSRVRLWYVLALGTWFFLNDWGDYGPLDLHPGLPADALIQTMAMVAVATTLGLTVIFAVYTRRLRDKDVNGY